MLPGNRPGGQRPKPAPHHEPPPYRLDLIPPPPADCKGQEHYKKHRNGLPFPFPPWYDLTGKSSRSEGYDHEKHRGFGLSVCFVEYDGFTANGRSDASGFRVSVDLPAGQADLK